VKATPDADREERKTCEKEMMAWLEKLHAETATIRAETKAIRERMAKLNAHHERTLGHREATETEPDPEMMQSAEEHQEIPNEDASVMPVGEPRKWLRVQNLAAERRLKRKKRTRGNRGSRRKSAFARRKVIRHAGVAWRKRVVVRKYWTQENYGPLRELTSAGKRMTHSAKVTRGKEHGLQRIVKDNIASRTQRGRTSRTRRFVGPECNSGIRDRDLRQQLRGKTGIKNARRRWPLRLKSERTTSEFGRKALGLEFVKREDAMSSGLRKIRKWTLWRGKPL
jgi:hypothetical protein